MAKELTNSNIDRQNILNNQYAIMEIQKAVQLQGIVFENKLVFVIDQLADFFEVTAKTIKNYLKRYKAELCSNGYEVLKGKRLKEFKLYAKWSDVKEKDFLNIKISQLGIFDFRAFLNIGMLLVESERARLLRLLSVIRNLFSYPEIFLRRVKPIAQICHF